ncbi:MAG: phage head-tail connector protein [Alphaproteobacteria bacterium]|nr:phage head-tail connector protein [Alphaproteobacteria bacterium]
MTGFTLLTPPAAEPVTLADAKQQARIDTTADDTLVTALITGARQWAEEYTARAFITQSWRLTLDLWPGAVEKWWDGVKQGPITGLDDINYISLPRAPLQSVTSVTSYDNADNGTLWDAGNYFVDTVRAPGRIALRMGAVWPVPLRLTNGIVIDYVSGYGSDGTSVPEPIKTAIRQLVAHWYEYRGEAATAPTSRSGSTIIRPAVPVPLVIQALLDPYRIRYSGA